MHHSFVQKSAVLLAGLLSVVVVTATSCSEEIRVQAPLGGSCLQCHDGITDSHPFFALACVDCHGGNDKVPVATILAGRQETQLNIRDQEIMKQSHVLPLDPEMWWPNGIDDNGDGRVDEKGEFFDGRTVDQDGNSGLSEGRLAKRDQFDSEVNRDINYLRFINPGDLRVAQVSCGNRNNNSNAAMVCHAEQVYDMRRSIMTTNAGVVTGANYGNAQLPKAADFADLTGSPFAERFDQRNPRIGRVGYTFNYDAIDTAFVKGEADVDRNLVTGGFDRESLLSVARTNQDPNDDLFEATAGPILDDGSDPLDPGVGLTRTGQSLKFFDAANPNDNRSVEILENIPNAANRTFPAPNTALELRLKLVLGLDLNDEIVNAFDQRPITNPVDAALRVFRAYHPLNYMSPSDNFGFVDFFTSPNQDDPPPADSNDVELRNNNNPFGRMRPSGCTSCHMAYANDGKNREEVDRTVADNGRAPETDLPFGLRSDLGQRGYPARHELKRAVEIQQCASCHGFVTRVDYAVNGQYEHETDFTNLEKVATIGPITFTTPVINGVGGSCVNIFDNLAHYKNGRILNPGEGVSEDLNNNGELDAGEDANNNNCLDIPDRNPRSQSFDGRQPRLVYGGKNGAIHLKDVHIEVGLECVDCHYFSRHGDGNIYGRNWDAEPLECEDCHGTPYAAADLRTSGPNGGDALDDPKFSTVFGKPWFEKVDGKVIQHSRSKANLQWEVSQLVDEAPNDPKTAYAKYAHEQPFETGPDPGRDLEARGFAHVQETGKAGGLECYSCHSSWQPNCLTCHMKMDVTKAKQEIWWGDDDVEDVFFQLFSYTRSPFILGRSGDVEGNRIATHRSLMQLHYNVVAGSLGVTVADNVMFSTQNNLSSQVSNPYFPHTVRVTETKSCARCHTLKDNDGNIANDHLITEASGQGTGRYMNVGDWALVAGSGGFDQIDIKKETQGAGIVFPGFDLDATNPRRVNFNPGATVNEVALVRGVSFQNGSGDIADIALVAHQNGVSIVDVTGRDRLAPIELARIDSLGPIKSIDHADPAANQSTRFVVVTDEELCTIDFRNALETATVAALVNDILEGNVVGPDGTPDSFAQGTEVVGCVPHGKDAVSRVRQLGRFVVVVHGRGISLFAMDTTPAPAEIDLGAPIAEVATFETTQPALDLVTLGRFAYVASGEGGVQIFDVGPVIYPLGESVNLEPVATALLDLEQRADARGVALYGTRLLVADGANGLRIVDVTTPADPRLELTIKNLAQGGAINQANAVVVATEPTRSFALVADGTNGLRAVNITEARDYREKLAAAAADVDASRGLRLSFERQDPLTPYDPKNATRQVLTFATTGSATFVARGLGFDSIADKTGRRMRDNWLIGSTSLDENTVARMRRVIVKEVPNTADIRGDGLGCVVREGDENNTPLDPNDPNRCMPVLP